MDVQINQSKFCALFKSFENEQFPQGLACFNACVLQFASMNLCCELFFQPATQNRSSGWNEEQGESLRNTPDTRKL